jgi:hypothetical protein
MHARLTRLASECRNKPPTTARDRQYVAHGGMCQVAAHVPRGDGALKRVSGYEGSGGVSIQQRRSCEASTASATTWAFKPSRKLGTAARRSTIAETNSHTKS